jgi:hypothetical protein
VKLNIREKFSTEKRLFPENAHPVVKIEPPSGFARLDFGRIAPLALWARFSLIHISFSSFL